MPCDPLIDDDGRVTVGDKKIVHYQPHSTPVTVRKWMDVLQLGVKVGRGSENVLLPYFLQLREQFENFLLYVLQGRADFVTPGHIVVALEFAWPFSQLPVAGIVGVLSEPFLKFPQQFHREGAFFFKRLQKQLIGVLGIANSKRCS